DIGQIVSGIGQQGHGIGAETEDRLDDDETEVQRDADGKSFAEASSTVAVMLMRMAGAHCRALAEASAETQMRFVEHPAHVTKRSSCDNVSSGLGGGHAPITESL